jgi:hypothetical protein
MSNSMLGNLIALPTSRNDATPPLLIRTAALGFLFPYSQNLSDPGGCILRLYNMTVHMPLAKATLDNLALGLPGVDLTPTPAPVFDTITQTWHTPQA